MNALTNKPVTMSSREIAELTGKEHYNVMRDIRSMLQELGKDAFSFEGIYLDAYGREKPCFNLPRREVEILLTGYSIPLRAKVIDRLHELEEQAKGAAFRVPQSLPEALRLAAELAEKNEQLALENKEMAPKAVVFDNCVALRQESLATFVRTLEGVNTMAIITNHRSHSAASKSTASITGASTSGLKSFPYRLKVIPPL
ncbi:Rha family transcriptional regulator [Pseudomonas kunmingensis]|uniref:Rha family transcriptional regulator n=1 Tax=Stutzerimonas kunmingensis TaxID=1211807 RepID=UPI001745D044|nr:Rha family transcriptional regulator [Stutzerimonas kunmingensis]MBD3875018.1 Rha family transcriptional regulator [Stutzerimonas kunmingensis]